MNEAVLLRGFLLKRYPETYLYYEICVGVSANARTIIEPSTS